MPDSGVLHESWEQRSARITDWLIGDGKACQDVSTLLAQLSVLLIENGLPIVRASSHMQALHSEHIGVTRIWRPSGRTAGARAVGARAAGGRVEELFFPHGARTDDRYLRSPLKKVYDSGEWLEIRIGEDDSEDDASTFNIVPDLREEGVRHYVVAPLSFCNGTRNALTWSTDRPEGFAPEHMTLFRSILPSVNAALELRALYQTLGDLVRIYAGRGPGERILSGQVQRGAVTRIDSAMLFCDLRNFTGFSTAMSAEDLVLLLNNFFDQVLPPIIGRAGEILKFLGDGVLAIFPAGEEDQSVTSEKAAHYACAAALQAAEAIMEAIEKRNEARPGGSPPIEASIALHYGAAAYGNIGSGERQDFTIIGRDVNLTSRLNGLSSVLERPILMSEEFAGRVGTPCCPLGSFELKGIDTWTPVYAPEAVNVAEDAH